MTPSPEQVAAALEKEFFAWQTSMCVNDDAPIFLARIKTIALEALAEREAAGRAAAFVEAAQIADKVGDGYRARMERSRDNAKHRPHEAAAWHLQARIESDCEDVAADIAAALRAAGAAR